MRATQHKLILAISLLAFSSINFAMDVPKNFPKDLIYKNQPIDPLCFQQNENSDATVELNKCGIQATPEAKIIGEDKMLIHTGYVGYDYNPSHSYSYYKVFNKSDGSHIIYLLNSGGGSGQFSSLYYVKRIGNNLKIKLLKTGDRCNNGIYSVKIDDHMLRFRINITPYDFLEIADENPHHLKPYDDLSACAACCAGSASYEINLNEDNNEEKFVSANLQSEAEHSSILTQGKYQACFNKVAAKYLDEGKRQLVGEEFKKFAQTINTECVKK